GCHAVQDIVEGRGDLAGRVVDMPVRRQQAAGPQYLRRLGGAAHGVHPMPGLPGDDRVESPAARVPGFEVADFDLDPGPPGNLGHPGVRFDAQHRDTGLSVLPCADAGATADVQEINAGAGHDDALYQGVGIPGPDPVVAIGVHSEGLRDVPLQVRLPV